MIALLAYLWALAIVATVWGAVVLVVLGALWRLAVIVLRKVR